MKSLLWSVPFVFLSVFLGCGKGSARSSLNLHSEVDSSSVADVPYIVRKTPSGKELRIRILGMDLNQHPKFGKNLVFRYQSDLPLSNAVAIKAEVDDVWSIFVKDCDQCRVETAVVQVSGAPSGLLISKKAIIRFVYKKEHDGRWKFQQIDEQTQYSINSQS